MGKLLMNRKSQSGFTIIETIMVLGILAIVLASLYGVLRTQQRSYAVQEDVSMTQRDTRAAIALLERDVRMAGFGVPRGTRPISALQNGLQTNANAPDQFSINYSVGSLTFLTSDVVAQPGNNIQVDAVTGFAIGDRINLIYLENNNLIGTYTINGVDPATRLVALSGTPAGIGVGTLMVKVFRTITYSVIANATTNRNELHRNDGTRDAVVIDSVQDFQLTYGLSDGSSSSSPADLSTIRRVQISVTAQTHRQATQLQNQARSRQLITTIPIKNVRV